MEQNKKLKALLISVTMFSHTVGATQWPYNLSYIEVICSFVDVFVAVILISFERYEH